MKTIQLILICIMAVAVISCEKEEINTNFPAHEQKEDINKPDPELSRNEFSEEVIVYDKTGKNYVKFLVSSKDEQAMKAMVDIMNGVQIHTFKIQDFISQHATSTPQQKTTELKTDGLKNDENNGINIIELEKKLPVNCGYTIDLHESTYFQQKLSYQLPPAGSFTITTSPVSALIIQNVGPTTLAVLHMYFNAGWQFYGTASITYNQFYNNTSTGYTIKKAHITNTNGSLWGHVAWSTY